MMSIQKTNIAAARCSAHRRPLSALLFCPPSSAVIEASPMQTQVSSGPGLRYQARPNRSLIHAFPFLSLLTMHHPIWAIASLPNIR